MFFSCCFFLLERHKCSTNLLAHGLHLLFLYTYTYNKALTNYSSVYFILLLLRVCIFSLYVIYYPTLLPRVQISRETSTNNRYLYSPHSSRPREAQNLSKSEFWEKKSLDNKSLIRRFGV